MQNKLLELLKNEKLVGPSSEGLVEQGRKKVLEAFSDMPFTKLIEEPVCVEAIKNMSGSRISGCLHVTPQTAVLVELLKKLNGVDVRWSACNAQPFNSSE